MLLITTGDYYTKWETESDNLVKCSKANSSIHIVIQIDITMESDGAGLGILI